MSKARDLYYALKYQVDGVFEDIKDPVHDYVNELEQQNKELIENIIKDIEALYRFKETPIGHGMYIDQQGNYLRRYEVINILNNYKPKEKQMENKLTEQQFREIAKYINIEYVGGSHGMNEQSIESSLRDLKQKGLVFEIPQNKCKHKRLKEDESSYNNLLIIYDVK